jgi:hypothetical protein
MKPSAACLALVFLSCAWVSCGSRPESRGAVRNGEAPVTGRGEAGSAAHAVSGSRRPNRLAREKSPYLLQHAYNPVDWYAWGDEAFARARREDKPILLSIGYSTCHWCHVMERESFENDSVAALLNRWFVSIKVDREERPDVDRVYMTAMHAMGLGGGWPLNVFLTPDLHPFFGGTYFPPGSRYGRPGLMQLLPRIQQAWLEHRPDLENSGAQVMAQLAGLSFPGTAVADRLRLFDLAYTYFEGSYDAERGGFGNAPKFPSTSNLAFLLRDWARDPKAHPRAKEMVLRQLDRMRAGGIHDHLGGGFHRYSTDRIWLVPHFEKMLYDQAQIAWAYLEGYQVTGNKEYAETARGIFEYVARDLSSPEGAFYSAEDADSEGEEGKFYVWRSSEVEAVLGKGDAALFDLRYGVTPAGNFEHGASILNESHGVESVAAQIGIPVDQAERRLAQARVKLLEARSKRIRPHRDDKVLAAWNGLMISAYARGARVLGDESLARRAEHAAEFVWSRLYDPGTRALQRRWREGEAAEAGQLDDYAYLALGFVDLYGATYDAKWLSRAVLLTEGQIERFWDEREGAFFDSPAGDPHLNVRLKDSFDGAEMAGNSIALSNLQLLGTLLDRDEWLAKARRGFDYFARRLREEPAGMPQMLAAMDLEKSTPRHVVIAGEPGDDATRKMLREFNRRFLPHDLLLLVRSGESRQELVRLAPFTEPLTSQRGRATAYVCVNYACRLPTTNPRAFAAQLEERPSARR